MNTHTHPHTTTQPHTYMGMHNCMCLCTHITTRGHVGTCMSACIHTYTHMKASNIQHISLYRNTGKSPWPVTEWISYHSHYWGSPEGLRGKPGSSKLLWDLGRAFVQPPEIGYGQTDWKHPVRGLKSIPPQGRQYHRLHLHSGTSALFLGGHIDDSVISFQHVITETLIQHVITKTLILEHVTP